MSPEELKNRSLGPCGAFISNAKEFTISGGVFNNYSSAATIPSDFRKIWLGDIHLSREICSPEVSGHILGGQRRPHGVRKVYSAKIEGNDSTFAVAMYQGNGAEQLWREDCAQYIAVRHPSIVQIYAMACSESIHAMIFHDDLIPFRNFLDLYEKSPIATVFIYASVTAELQQVRNYLSIKLQYLLYNCNCTLLIRRATGGLSADVFHGDSLTYIGAPLEPIPLAETTIPLLDAPGQETRFVEFLTLREYHRICSLHLTKFRTLKCSPFEEAHLGAMVYFWQHKQPGYEELFQTQIEMAYLPDADLDLDLSGWCDIEGQEVDVMQNGWTRVPHNEAGNAMITRWVSAHWQHDVLWLSQANHIFSRLGVASNFTDYVILTDAIFELNIFPTNSGNGSHKGFLFLCPPQDFQIEPTVFRWPECPAYWSLDPQGVERLTTEEAAALGFPSFILSTDISGSCWSESVYTGLRDFHRGKGFHSDNSDVALHLGEPLYGLVSSVKATPFADDIPQLRKSRPAVCNEFCLEFPDAIGFSSTMKIQLFLILLLILLQLHEFVSGSTFIPLHKFI
ncbi:hypothetical protein R3P38DRAFT_2877113 [Favolaschia claudopus]|uniref:Protein kinase domain-containing protein n=1 Tax=Favolaschia claudopus TaxID=2862362 RepID=A0AAW0D3I4_9AGAR